MRARSTFTAVLIHGSGPERGVREEVVVPLLGVRPPELLRRPVNDNGMPAFEDWQLESLDEWTAAEPVALYRFLGHSRRDPNVRPDTDSGRVLPWRR